jgi:hypothetical protein
MLVNIGWEPRFDELRADPRFQAMVKDIRLPDRPRPKAANPSAAKPVTRGM